MTHTIKQIIVNQSKFEKEIKDWLKNDFEYQQDVLEEIDPNGDQQIEDAINSLQDRFDKIKVDFVIKSLFFKSGLKKRSKHHYAWWDEENETVILYKYGKKIIKSTDRLRVRWKHE